jgi:protein transport protein SEC13
MTDNGTPTSSPVTLLAAIPCHGQLRSSWVPYHTPTSLRTWSSSQNATVKRFASAGCDNLVKIWGYNEETQSQRSPITDWVRDVAWAPNIGLPRSYIAASQDTTVSIWTKDSPTSPWVKTPLGPSSTIVSPTGSPAPAGIVWRVT